MMHEMSIREPQGRPRKLDADLDEYEIDAALANWARWARGWPDTVGCKTCMWPTSVSEECADPQTVLPIDVDRAMAVERVLLAMRARRPKLWRAVRLRYISRWTDISGAHAMRVSTPEFRALVLRAYSWLDSRL